MKSKLGPAAATTAAAHKIAIVFYTMVKNQVETARRFGLRATLSVGKGSTRNSNGRLSNSATNWYPSKKKMPHNRLY
jgi:hypothetical protein